MKNKETPEEVAERLYPGIDRQVDRMLFINGYQQAEKHLYSEEDMLNFAWFLVKNIGQYSCDRTAHFKGEYLKKFKK
jgi:hypothetical protein